MDLLQGLNAQQQQAVMAGLGPVLVMAGPGSGKTRVLTQRIAYLIGSMGVSPYHILAVTFTNKAAREMEKRVYNLLGESGHGLWLGTFHSICARILRREAAANNLPFNANFVIFDADDQVSVVKRALAELNIDEKRFRPSSVHAAISNAKNELVLPEQFAAGNNREETIQRVYKRYQEMLLANNAVDFDDLLLWTAYLLESNQIVREKYARRYEHVLVDEFQDTNVAQYTLLKHLASFHNNIFVVGDTDQAIYRWRGADYRNVIRFQRDYPETQVILLEQNYRSTQGILDVAMAVIDQNPYRTRKQLFTDRGTGNRVIVHECYDDRVEAAYVVETIATQVAQNGARPGDYAVMYRTNAQSRLLEEAFLQAGLPYKLVGAQRFYGRREIKDLIAFLRLIHNPSDEISLTRILNVPPRGIGDKTLNSLFVQAQIANKSPAELLIDLGTNERSPYASAFTGRAGVSLSHFGSLLANWIASRELLNPLGLMDQVIGDTEYRVYIDDGSDEGTDRWENVMELRRLAAEYPEPGLSEFLEQIALVSDQDTVATNGNVPTLLTLHAAKGLEFPVVFITGLNEGVLPHSRSFDDEEEMMEERRLFYVGITRAENQLYLTYTQNRSSYGLAEPALPSRFLDDIPAELVTLTGQQARVRRSRGYDDSTYTYESWEPVRSTSRGAKNRSERPPVKSQYAPGMRVEHPVWGEGMVLNTRMDGEDEIVDVFFENGIGLKRVMASMARLEIKS